MPLSCFHRASLRLPVLLPASTSGAIEFIPLVRLLQIDCVLNSREDDVRRRRL
jgi:hypothetical protein